MARRPIRSSIKQLLRRLTLLHACHGGAAPAWDHRAWIAAAAAVTVVDAATTWRDRERYSTRQHARMRLGGWQGAGALHWPVAALLAPPAGGRACPPGTGYRLRVGPDPRHGGKWLPDDRLNARATRRSAVDGVRLMLWCSHG